MYMVKQHIMRNTMHKRAIHAPGELPYKIFKKLMQEELLVRIIPGVNTFLRVITKQFKKRLQ